jgi:hypothetical protein
MFLQAVNAPPRGPANTGPWNRRTTWTRGPLMEDARLTANPLPATAAHSPECTPCSVSRPPRPCPACIWPVVRSLVPRLHFRAFGDLRRLDDSVSYLAAFFTCFSSPEVMHAAVVFFHLYTHASTVRRILLKHPLRAAERERVVELMKVTLPLPLFHRKHMVS